MTIGKPLLGADLQVVNIGLDLFAEALEELGVPVVHLDWRPTAGGDVRLAGLLERLKGGGTPATSSGGSSG